jgi:hypothetical protein
MRPQVFIEKIMPVNLLNEQVSYEGGGTRLRGCIAGIPASRYRFLALRYWVRYCRLTLHQKNLKNFWG